MIQGHFCFCHIFGAIPPMAQLSEADYDLKDRSDDRLPVAKKGRVSELDN